MARDSRSRDACQPYSENPRKDCLVGKMTYVDVGGEFSAALFRIIIAVGMTASRLGIETTTCRTQGAGDGAGGATKPWSVEGALLTCSGVPMVSFPVELVTSARHR